MDKPIQPKHEVRELQKKKGEVCDSLLRSLPRWFAIEQAIVDYVKAVESLPTFVTEIEGRIVDFISLEFHNPYTCEIHVMGVREEHHRHGVGRALIEVSENMLAARAQSISWLKR